MATSFTFNPFTSNFDVISTITLAAVGSSPNANAATLTGQVLNLQPADGTHPGVVSTGTQTFGGNKTFTGTISASNLSGTNTGDVTLAAVGTSPNANAASLSGQVLNLQPADATNPGVVSTASQSWAGLKTFVNTIAIGTGGTFTTAPLDVTSQSIGNPATFFFTAYSGSAALSPGANVSYRGARNTLASPSALQANDTLGIFGGRGYGATSFSSSSRVVIQMKAAENWSDTAQGTDIRFFTCLNTTVIAGERMRIGNEGNVAIGGATTTTAKLGIKGGSDQVQLLITGNATQTSNVITVQNSALSNLLTLTNAGNLLATGSSNGIMAANSIKGNNTGSPTTSIDLSVSQVQTMLSIPTSSSPLPLASGGTGVSAGSANAAFNALSPMTTQGDVIYGGASGAATRLARGTANQVLQIQGSSTSPSWQGIYQNVYPNYISSNPNFEVDTTGWATYANTAQPTPVTGTGGSPTTTLTRSTSSPLRGTASGLITKDAANRQGEGASYNFTIDSADINRILTIQFDYSASTNFVAGSLSDITIWIYDVTNSVLIQPNPYNIVGSSGTFVASFISTASTSYRLIYQIATTNALAWTFKLDNVQVLSQQIVYAATTTPWQTYAGLVAGLGTGGTTTLKYRQIGDSIEIQGTATAGASSSGTVSIPMPGGMLIDGSKIPAGTQAAVGMFDAVGSSGNIFSTGFSAFVFYDGSDTSNLYLNNTSSGGYAKAVWVGVATNSQAATFWMRVPVVGLSASIASANGRVFNISGVLANGTRVTSTPVALGQYRAYQKNVTAATGSDAAATTLPSATNGIAIGAFNYATAGSGSFNISRYEIFVGAGKYCKPIFYSATGFSGGVDATPQGFNLATALGCQTEYNSSTGVFIVDCIPGSITTTSNSIGVQVGSAGAATTAITTGYFDIAVSENAIGVTADVFPSARYYASATTISGSLATITYSTKDYDTNAAYSSGIYTIPSSGKYHINASLYADATFATATTSKIQIQKNTVAVSEGNTNGANSSIASQAVFVSDIINCVAGDAIRIQMSTTATSPTVNASTTANYFSIAKITA